ncbi:MAG: hypothetical protein EOM04_08740 [Clostridia bacterium]|nr:hypothetical protein [Clostridia bacterium]
MDFSEWLSVIKKEVPELDAFISRLEPFFLDSGFNGVEFEKRVHIGIKKMEDEVDAYLIEKEDA